MNFTKSEQSIILELEKRAGSVLYFRDIAPYFITNSCLQISTYTQTAYIQVGENMQNALSEYFQLVVFIKKLEQNGVCFSIPYIPLEDNLVKIGNNDFNENQQHTIADGDLLIQLFQYAGKKYVIAPTNSNQFKENISSSTPKQSKINFIIPSLIVLMFFLFIGAIGYQSFENSIQLKLKQEAIGAELHQQTYNIELLSSQVQHQGDIQKVIQTNIQKEFSLINNSLEDQNEGLRSVRYWNKKQYDQLEKIVELIKKDSIM